ncbi:uncharacterized protein [Argopecten irradians]|uniref:uncharacterized protein n=1 Tax=Argopecten irradians TaxID=31199 RepID=UPI00371BEA7C
MTKTKISAVDDGVASITQLGKPNPEIGTTCYPTTEEDKRWNCLISALRPLLISMSVVGLFDVWKLRDINDKNPASKRTLFKLYHLGVVCILGFNFIRFFHAYNSFAFGSELLSTVYSHAWFFLCFVYAAMNYRIVQNPTKLSQFFTQWNQYWCLVKKAPKDVSQEDSWKHIRRFTTITTIITWVFVLINVSFICYLIFHGHSEPNLLEPITEEHDLFILVACLGQIVGLCCSCAWCFVTTFLIVIFLSLYYEFKNLVNRFEKMTQTLSTSQIRENIEAIREQHTALCDMLDTGDCVFKHYIGACIFFHIFITLLLLYNLCWHDTVRDDFGQLLTHVFWLIAVIGVASVVMVTCSLVNIKAHEPASFIYKMSMKDITPDFTLQVNVFLHRLNGPPIGLTAWSLFVVDNQVIVSVAGMLATYFVVLLQFQQSATNPATSLNSTLPLNGV